MATTTTLDVAVHPATPDRWDDVVTVMGTRGDPARCWCQYFILRGRQWSETSDAAKRARLRRQVRGDGPPPGVLAYIDGEPAGWCAVGPTTGYPRLAHARAGGPARDGAWAVTCFVVRVGFRRRGIATALLDGAVELSRANGAQLVEAYPVDVDARTGVSSAALYHGTLSLFLGAGFREVARPVDDRPTVELAL